MAVRAFAGDDGHEETTYKIRGTFSMPYSWRQPGYYNSFASLHEAKFEWNGFSLKLGLWGFYGSGWDHVSVLFVESWFSAPGDVFPTYNAIIVEFSDLDSGTLDGVVNGEFEFVINKFNRHVLMTRGNDLSQNFPQEGYTAVIVDPDDGHYYPYKHGHTNWVETSLQEYSKVTPDDVGFSGYVKIGSERVDKSGTIPFSTTLLSTCGVRFSALTSAVNDIVVGTKEAIYTLTESTDRFSLPYNFTPISISSTQYGTVNGTVGELRVRTGIPQPFEIQEVILEGEVFPDLKVAPRFFFRDQDQNALSLFACFSWEFDGLHWIDGKPDFLNGCPKQRVSGLYSKNLNLQRCGVLFRALTNGTDVYSTDFRIDQQSYGLFVFLDPLSLPSFGFSAPSWRCLTSDIKYDAFAIQRVASNVVDACDSTTGWTPTNGSVSLDSGDVKLTVSGGTGSMTKSYMSSGHETIDLRSSRFLPIVIKSSTTQDVTFTITYRVYNLDDDVYEDHDKSYLLSLSGGFATITLDLKAPDSDDAGLTVDMTSHSQYATTQALFKVIGQNKTPIYELAESSQEWEPSTFAGVGKVKSITIGDVDDGTTVTIQEIRQSRRSAKLTVLPAVQLSKQSDITRSWADYDPDLNKEPIKYSPQGKTQIMVFDSQLILNLGYATFDLGSLFNTGYPTIKQTYDLINEIPGFVASSAYLSNGADPKGLRDNLKFDLADISMVKYSSDMINAPTATPIVDADCGSGYILEARFLRDIVWVYHGIGDPANQPGGYYPLVAYITLGGKIYGSTFDTDTCKSAKKIPIKIKRGSTIIQSLESDDLGDFRSKSLSTYSTNREYTIETDDASASLVVQDRQWRQVQLCGPVEIKSEGTPVYSCHKNSYSYIVYSRDDKLWCKRSPHPWKNYTEEEVINSGNPSQYQTLAIEQNAAHLLLLATVEDGALSLMINSAYGKSEGWLTVSIASGVSDKRPAIAKNDHTGQISIFYCKDGATLCTRGMLDTQGIFHAIETVTAFNEEIELNGQQVAHDGSIVMVYKNADDEIHLLLSGSDGKDFLNV